MAEKMHMCTAFSYPMLSNSYATSVNIKLLVVLYFVYEVLIAEKC